MLCPRARVRIDICIATFQRPILLERLLRDLSAQQLPDDVATQIIVVDNDVRESARAVVTAFQSSGAPIEYLTQPEQNIALTRNRALDHSQGDLIAFIDDDESAPKDWLATLLTTMERCAADIVLGPVNGVLPPGAPGWLVKGRFFEQPERRTGVRVKALVGGTGNALMRASAVRGRFAFNPRFGLSGGEDTDFFHRLWRSGAVVVWCQEARLTEAVPEERMTVRWLLRRAIRTGQTYAEILNRPEGGLRFVGWIILKLVAVLITGGLAVAAFPISRSKAMHFAIKCTSNVGQLSWIASYRLLEYKQYV